MLLTFGSALKLLESASSTRKLRHVVVALQSCCKSQQHYKLLASSLHTSSPHEQHCILLPCGIRAAYCLLVVAAKVHTSLKCLDQLICRLAASLRHGFSSHRLKSSSPQMQCHCACLDTSLGSSSNGADNPRDANLITSRALIRVIAHTTHSLIPLTP